MRSELGADVPADEIAHNMPPAKSTGHIGRELGNLVAMGLAFVTRSEPTGRRPKRYWKVSEFALSADDDSADPLREPQEGSKGSNGSNAIRSIRSIKTHFQEGEEGRDRRGGGRRGGGGGRGGRRRGGRRRGDGRRRGARRRRVRRAREVRVSSRLERSSCL